MKKEWILLAAVSAITITIALLGVRYFAPQLLGIPIDLQSVQVSQKVPPFFENIFRPEDYSSSEFLIKDPYVRVRAKPLLVRSAEAGPHDVLGFRNHAVPSIADIVVIGDSQTYGNNSLLEASWPFQMKGLLHSEQIVYSMATGGWGAIQYLDMTAKSSAFKPRVIIVAFYSGNDPLETFSLVYDSAGGVWDQFKVNQDTDASDRPKFVGFPSPPDKNWRVRFNDDLETVFTPSLRLMSNDISFSVVKESWAIMAKIVENMGRIADSVDSQLIVTMIPTKELAYLNRIDRDQIPLDPIYGKLVRLERRNITQFFERVGAVRGVQLVDIVPDLQTAALGPRLLYPTNENGHPNDLGYRTIGAILADKVNNLLPVPSRSLKTVRRSDGSPSWYFLSRQNKLLVFASPQVVADNGWDLSEAENITTREFNKPISALISGVDKPKYGPPQ